jgi:phospholipid/cholesterol/gamma-HCH transport system substrate-binding protein
MVELEIKPTRRMRMRVFALVATGVFISFVLMYLLIGGGADFFARRTTLTTYMPDAGGIVKNAEVRLSGIRIGVVKSVELSGRLDPRRSVRTEMRVLTRYLKGIPEDSQTDISADTLVGYKFIDIAEGKSPIPVKEDGVLQSEPVQQAADRADLIKTLQTNLAGIDSVVANMSSPDTKIGKFFLTDAMYNTLLSNIRGFDSELHTFLTPQSDMGRAFYSEKMYNDIHNAVTDFDKTLASIQKGEGTAGHLFASDEQYNEILRELTSLRSSLADANAGKGQFGALLQDDARYRQITRLLADTDRTIASINAGEGQAGRLLANAQLYESLNGSLRRMEELLRDVRMDPRKYLRVKPFGK